MQRNPIRFAIVREDPRIELEAIRRCDCRNILLVASGGCTALSLKACEPELAITLVDPNPAQLELVRRKIAALSAIGRSGIAREHPELRRRFGIASEDRDELTAGGSFESLFRQLRLFLYELVAIRERWLAAFTSRRELATLRIELRASPYWPVAFEMFFSDPLLVAMFGPDAVQHAEPGSYPRYFREAFERGLDRDDAFDNPWLHHALLGHHLDRPACLPDHLMEPLPELELPMRCCSVEQVDDLDRFDLVSLSNVMDWMSADSIAKLAERLAVRMRPGAVLVYRQLNHRETFDPYFAPAFDLDADTARRMLAADRSLFYSHLAVGTRKQVRA